MEADTKQLTLIQFVYYMIQQCSENMLTSPPKQELHYL